MDEETNCFTSFSTPGRASSIGTGPGSSVAGSAGLFNGNRRQSGRSGSLFSPFGGSTYSARTTGTATLGVSNFATSDSVWKIALKMKESEDFSAVELASVRLTSPANYPSTIVCSPSPLYYPPSTIFVCDNRSALPTLNWRRKNSIFLVGWIVLKHVIDRYEYHYLTLTLF